MQSRTEKPRPQNMDYEGSKERRAREYSNNRWEKNLKSQQESYTPLEEQRERSGERIARKDDWEKNRRSQQKSFRQVEERKERSEVSKISENKELKLRIVNNQLVGKNHEVSQYLAQYSQIQEIKAAMDKRIKSNMVDYYAIQLQKNAMKDRIDNRLRNLSPPKVTDFWESNLVDKLEMEWSARKRSEIFKNARSVLYSPYINIYGSGERGTGAHVDAHLRRLNQKYTRILETNDYTTRDTVDESCNKDLKSKDTRLDWDIIGLDWRTTRNPIIDSFFNKYLKKDPEEPVVSVKKESPRNKRISPGKRPLNAAKSIKLPVHKPENLHLTENKSLKDSITSKAPKYGEQKIKTSRQIKPQTSRKSQKKGKKKGRVTRKITPQTEKNDLLNSLYKTPKYESCFATDYSISINDGTNNNSTKDLKQEQWIEKPRITVDDAVKKTDFSIFLASSVSEYVHMSTDEDGTVDDEDTASKSESYRISGYSENQRKGLRQKFKALKQCLTFRKDDKTAEETQIRKLAKKKAKEEQKKEKEEMNSILYGARKIRHLFSRTRKRKISCSEMSGNLTLTSLESGQHHGGISQEEDKESSVDEEEEAAMRYLKSMD